MNLKNNPLPAVALLILMVVACSSGADDRPARFTATPNTAPRAESASNTTSTTPLALNTNSNASRTEKTKPASPNTATVIAENAYLRSAPNGEIVETLPESSSLGVIRQKGPWFYVAAGGRKGWMHGNTIRYDNPSRTVAAPEVPISKQPNTAYRSRQSDDSERLNPSGATARCRDDTLSFSRNRRGTCSHHGGVAVWF